LVTGIGGGGHGAQIIKALKMTDLPLKLYGADITHICKGRYDVDQFFLLPPANDEGYMDSLLSKCKEHRISILFHGSEPELKKMSENRKFIENAGIFLPINSEKVIDICMDKFQTIEFLKEQNIQYPETIKITCIDDIEKITQYPLVLKPSIGGGGSVNTLIVQSEDELKTFTTYLLNHYKEFIAQEYIGTPDSEYTVGVLSDMNGKLINSIAVKRMIMSSLGSRLKIKNMTNRKDLGDQLVVSSGISQGEIGKFSEITEQCEYISKAIKSKGPLNIQCRYVNGKVFVFEINPRYSGTTSFRAIVGFNEPELMIKYHYLKQNIQRNFAYKEGYILRGLSEVLIQSK